MAKTEGELKKQAEKALAKFFIFETNLLNNELEGLSDEERAMPSGAEEQNLGFRRRKSMKPGYLQKMR